MTREEFWDSKEADIIGDLLIEVTNRSDINELLMKIDPGYYGQLENIKKVFTDLYLE